MKRRDIQDSVDHMKIFIGVLMSEITSAKYNVITNDMLMLQARNHVKEKEIRGRSKEYKADQQSSLITICTAYQSICIVLTHTTMQQQG